jgi:hypothetical protein
MKRAAFSWSAGGGHGPAMLLGYASADKKAQPHARESSVIDIAASVEALEYMLKVFPQYTDALIDDCNVVTASIVPQFYMHRPTLRAVLDGVLHQILDQLQDSDRIVLPNYRLLDLYPAGVALRMVALADLSCQRREVGLFFPADQLPLLRARRVK